MHICTCPEHQPWHLHPLPTSRKTSTFFLRLEPPTRVIIPQKYTLIRSLQPIISFSSIPTFILPLHDIPQDAHEDDVPNEVTQSLT